MQHCKVQNGLQRADYHAFAYKPMAYQKQCDGMISTRREADRALLNVPCAFHLTERGLIQQTWPLQHGSTFKIISVVKAMNNKCI